MLIVHWLSCSFSFAALHQGKPRVHYVCKCNGFQPGKSNGYCSSFWQGEQYRGFCSLLASPPRVPLRVHDWVAKAFSALSFHSMLETAHKATHLSKSGNKHAGEAYPVCTVLCRLQYWNDGTWDKEAMVRKRDRHPLKKPFSHHKESISFPLSKALERLK